MRKCIKGFTIFLTVVLCGVWGLIIYYADVLPESFNVTDGKSLYLNGMLEVREDGIAAVQKMVGSGGESYQTSLRLFGLFPVKEVSVKVVEEPVVVVAGTPFGIKMYTDGVLVVGFSDVYTASGPCNPARIAGLKEGDVILSVNGQAISTNLELRTCIEQSGGEQLELKVRRDNLLFTIKFRAVLSSSENRFRSGFWVRDSSAGIGTLTFYDPETKAFGGLGHAVCDVDTDERLPIADGEIVKAEIYSVEKGVVGTAGSLNGVVTDETLGTLSINAETGIYGTLHAAESLGYQTMPIAMKQQVKEGYAQVYTTVDGETPQLYDIKIEQIRYRDGSPTKNMVIRITDPKLLEITGGIVQGMSGSPIIQDGKLVGAVTHVLVNDPTKGYAIFAENMYETAKSISNQQLKEAS